jgi:uncharacterized OsmC-like protein
MRGSSQAQGVPNKEPEKEPLVEGDSDPSGVQGEPVNPRVQVFRVTMELEGTTEEQAAKLAEQFEARCPIHTTLSRSAPIELKNVVQ